MRDVWHLVEGNDFHVVPNFISEGYFTQKVIPRELELQGRVTRRDGCVIRYCDPVGSHPRMTEVLLRRASEAAPRVDPAQATLIIAGHGTDLNDNSARAAKSQVEKIRRLGIYAEVRSAYMEEAPRLEDWDKLSACPNVVVVPFFIADGLHSYQDIPVLLGIDPEPGPAIGRTGIFRQNPHVLRGRNLYLSGAIGADPLMVEVILEQVESFAASEGEKPGD